MFRQVDADSKMMRENRYEDVIIKYYVIGLIKLKSDLSLHLFDEGIARIRSV